MFGNFIDESVFVVLLANVAFNLKKKCRFREDHPLPSQKQEQYKLCQF